MTDTIPPRVFISYSHDSDEHGQRVLDLAQNLRRNGIDAVIDRFTPHPPEGWPRWMQHQIENSNFVLAVCTATYKRRFDGREDPHKGHGVNWEGFLTAQLIYDNRALNNRIIPVLFEDGAEANIPLVLRGSTHYQLPASFNVLLRRLTDQPEVIPEPLGQTPYLPPILPPLADASVESTGVNVIGDTNHSDTITHRNAQSTLDLLCSALETKYREISNRYTPLEVRADLRLCPWEPKFLFRNPIKRHSEEKVEQITLDYVETVNSSHRLVILGEPGSGKSTGLYAAAHKMATSRSEGSIHYVPIIINLNRYANFDARHPRDLLIQMIRDECNRTIPTSEQQIKTATVKTDLQAGQFCILFDGLNEVPASLRNKCVQSLIDFCDEFQQCKVTITSRKYMYNGELPFPAMEVLELGREDISGFVERHANDGGVTAQSILNVVEHTKWYLFLNPLALHMMIRVFQETKAVPENRALLIEGYIEILLEKHLSNNSRFGAISVSKNDVKKGLTAISELMSVHGLCLPSGQIEQQFHSLGQSPEKANLLLNIALESGLLVNEGGAARFWHHSIQEYFFVLGFYSHWKEYVGKDRASRKHIRNVLKRPERWETISLAAGLMNEEEAEVFLKECIVKDEYLTAMVLNHCGGIKPALLMQKKLINRSKIISLLSYWAGNILELEVIFRVTFILLWVKAVLQRSGYAFQKPSRISLPILGPGFTEAVLQFGLCIAVGVILRRLSDYLVFARFNTVIRALQHIGSPEARSELMKIFKKFSESARIELSYLTVIKRVVASNICTQTELFEGLKREEEKLYCITTLASVADLAAIPVVCDLIRLEKNKYVLEAAIDCAVSIANKFPQCKDEKQYRAALRHATSNHRLPISARLKAYAHFIEASGTALDIPQPRINWLEKVNNSLFSSRWTVYYILAVMIILVISQPNALAILINLLFPLGITNFSSSLIIQWLVATALVALVFNLLVRIDRNLQKRIRSRADRKWMSLGEATPIALRKEQTRGGATREDEIKHTAMESIWHGRCGEGGIHKIAAYGLRHGYTVDYLQADKILLRLMLRTDKTKAQVNWIYRGTAFFSKMFIWTVIAAVLNGVKLSLAICAVYVCLQIVELIIWLSINPHILLVMSQNGRRAEVEGKIYLGSRQFSVSKANEAIGVMAAVITEIAGKPLGGNPLPRGGNPLLIRTSSEKRVWNRSEEEAWEMRQVRRTINPPSNTLGTEIARIKITTRGDLMLDGRIVTLDDLELRLEKLKEKKGKVWYHREYLSTEPGEQIWAQVAAVIEIINKSGLYTEVCEQDFEQP